MDSHSILIVDDELELLEMLKQAFHRNGFTNIMLATSGASALSIFFREKIDLIITDVSMPELDGFALLQTVRSTSSVPVIMLTARGEIEDRIDGFELGADDYLVKPFSPKELILRVTAILKRTYKDDITLLDLGNVTINLEEALVIKGATQTPLTRKEFTIFMKLYENIGNIVTIGTLCQSVCEIEWMGYETTLMTHIRHLREKIEDDPSNPKHIITRKGLGYKLNKPEAER